jgi:hypothetical protein
MHWKLYFIDGWQKLFSMVRKLWTWNEFSVLWPQQSQAALSCGKWDLRSAFKLLALFLSWQCTMFPLRFLISKSLLGLKQYNFFQGIFEWCKWRNISHVYSSIGRTFHNFIVEGRKIFMPLYDVVWTCGRINLWLYRYLQIV